MMLFRHAAMPAITICLRAAARALRDDARAEARRQLKALLLRLLREMLPPLLLPMPLPMMFRHAAAITPLLRLFILLPPLRCHFAGTLMLPRYDADAAIFPLLFDTTSHAADAAYFRCFSPTLFAAITYFAVIAMPPLMPFTIAAFAR